jgi:hypothetical protein
MGVWNSSLNGVLGACRFTACRRGRAALTADSTGSGISATSCCSFSKSLFSLLRRRFATISSFLEYASSARSVLLKVGWLTVNEGGKGAASGPKAAGFNAKNR